MSTSKPAPPSRIEVDPADLHRSDAVGLPMVDERSSAGVRRISLDALDRGRDRGRIGVAVAVLGAMSPDEIERDLIPELVAMAAAARREQANSDASDAHDREVHELASSFTLATLREAMAGADVLGDDHDREVVAEAIATAETYLAAGITLCAGAA